MDDKLQRQLLRQLKILNIWVSFFGILLLAGLIVIGFFLWQLTSALSSAATKLQSIQDETSKRLDVRSQLCQSTQLGGLVAGSDFCKDPANQ